jgi:hypothetical protein
MAQSCAFWANALGSSIIILATSASCGSLGLGDSSNILSDIRAILMVPTGDQPLPRVSRQIAPWPHHTVSAEIKGRATCRCSGKTRLRRAKGTHRHTADIRVPYLGIELDDGGFKGVRVRDDDIDLILASGVRGVGRAGEGAFEVREARRIDRVGYYSRVILVVVYVCQLFHDPPFSSGRHVVEDKVRPAGGRRRKGATLRV